MKEKRNITIIDKKQIPSEEPARQYYFMDIAKKYVAELAEQKGAPLTFCVTTFGCQMNARDSEKLVGILEQIGYVEKDTEDADFVRQTIKEMGGKVDAWILTHPHQDHIGAFNAIYSDLQGIEIKEVYTVDMPSPKLCQERAHWDSVDTYNDFLDLNVKNLKYVYPGDELNICGLKVDIYNAYDEHVKELSQDYLNDGSMMFKVQGEKSSMLFCADVGKAMSDYLLDTWGEKLKADYIQMGHHGNGGLLKDFYEEVSPKLAFFDAPDWLMYDETGKYTTPENAKEMESLGSEVVSFHTQPNTVSIE